MTSIFLMYRDGAIEGAVIHSGMAQTYTLANPGVVAVPVLLLPTHQHYKGVQYSLIGEGHQTEDIGRSMVYVSDSGLWLRPPDMFAERVHPDTGRVTSSGGGVPRFKPLW